MLQHKFVEFVPGVIEEGILYISMEYSTAIHKCVCGCGNKVVTPLSPTDWQLQFDGRSISLDPSIGNWNFKCKSHYWIIKNQIIWSGKWDINQIERGRDLDRKRKQVLFDKVSIEQEPSSSLDEIKKDRQKMGIWRSFLKLIGLDNNV